MEVNVGKIKSEIINLDKLIDEYENNCLSLYNELNGASFSWKSDTSNLFFDKKQREKISINDFINEIKSYRDFFGYIVQTYGLIGEKVFYDLSNYNEANNKLLVLINEMKEVLQKLNQYRAKTPNSIMIINNEISQISNYINSLETLKEKLSIIFKKIEEFEKEIKYRLSKINFMVLNPEFID